MYLFKLTYDYSHCWGFLPDSVLLTILTLCSTVACSVCVPRTSFIQSAVSIQYPRVAKAHHALAHTALCILVACASCGKKFPNTDRRLLPRVALIIRNLNRNRDEYVTGHASCQQWNGLSVRRVTCGRICHARLLSWGRRCRDVAINQFNQLIQSIHSAIAPWKLHEKPTP